MVNDILIPKKKLETYLKRGIILAIEDEKKSFEEYNEMAELAERLEMQSTAEKFREIASDESKHYSILVDITKNKRGSLETIG